MDDGFGCLVVFLLVSVGLALLYYAAEKAVSFLSPYWPVISFGLVVALVLWVVRLVRRLPAVQRAQQRRRTEEQIARAGAQIRQIHREAAQQMEQARRRPER